MAQTRHFIKHLLHDFTICSTILQFAPRFYNLQFSPRFYNLLHDFTICSTILQFAPRFYNLLHDFIICSTLTIFSTILQPLFYNLLHSFTICSTILQFAPRFYNLLHDCFVHNIESPSPTNIRSIQSYVYDRYTSVTQLKQFILQLIVHEPTTQEAPPSLEQTMSMWQQQYEHLPWTVEIAYIMIMSWNCKQYDCPNENGKGK